MVTSAPQLSTLLPISRRRVTTATRRNFRRVICLRRPEMGSGTMGPRAGDSTKLGASAQPNRELVSRIRLSLSRLWITRVRWFPVPPPQGQPWFCPKPGSVPLPIQRLRLSILNFSRYDGGEDSWKIELKARYQVLLRGSQYHNKITYNYWSNLILLSCGWCCTNSKSVKNCNIILEKLYIKKYVGFGIIWFQFHISFFYVSTTIQIINDRVLFVITSKTSFRACFFPFGRFSTVTYQVVSLVVWYQILLDQVLGAAK